MKDDLTVFETFLTERWELWQVFFYQEVAVIDGAVGIEKAQQCLGSGWKRTVLSISCQQGTQNAESQGCEEAQQPREEAYVQRSQGPSR